MKCSLAIAIFSFLLSTVAHAQFKVGHKSAECPRLSGEYILSWKLEGTYPDGYMSIDRDANGNITVSGRGYTMTVDGKTPLQAGLNTVVAGCDKSSIHFLVYNTYHRTPVGNMWIVPSARGFQYFEERLIYAEYKKAE